MGDRVHEHLAAHRDRLVDQLVGWVRLRSVAGVPEHAVDVLRSANWLAAALRGTGFPVAEVWRTAGLPAVYAEWCGAPGAPTVLVYSHHDVRPARDGQWEETPPFDPAVRDGRVYGRGASDAKGQVLAHLWGVRAHLAATGRSAPAVNLRFLVEGEEEVGSTNLLELVREHRERLAADLVVFSDTQLWRADHPAVCTSVRGTTLAHLKVRGPLRDVHSGGVSGVSPNPAAELSRLVGLLHDENGRITLPGFYDAVVEPSKRVRADLAALPFSEQDWLTRSETGHITGEKGYTPLERLWFRPALEVLSLIAGDPLGASMAAIPSLADADLSIRTVPEQRTAEVAEQLRRWLDSEVGEGYEFELSVSQGTAQEAYRTPEDLSAVGLLAAAMEEGFGLRVGRMGNAGGGPADLLAREVGAPVLFFGTGLPEDRWHDSDERVSVDVLLAGAATLARFWQRLADA